MKLPIRTQPDLSAFSPPHQADRELGFDHFKLWERNVVDKYKGLTNEEIRTDLRRRAHPFAVCAEAWLHDLNLATLVRSANAFNARAVYYVGSKRYDKRAAAGTYNYTDVHFLPTIDDLVRLKDEYHFVGIDNIGRTNSLTNYRWSNSKPTMMIFGCEGTGLTPRMQELCEEMVEIVQFGSVRSLNVGVCSGIIMQDFVSKFYAIA